jgi:hypothetical protein
VKALLAFVVAIAACRSTAAPTLAPPSALPSSVDADALDAKQEGEMATEFPFHLAFVGPTNHSLGQTDPSGSLCPIAGQAFVCELSRMVVIEGPSIRMAPELESGLPTAQGEVDGVVDDIAGRWPDDAWLVLRMACCNPVLPYRLFHWSASANRWVARKSVEAVRLEIEATHRGLLVESTLWGDKLGAIHTRELLPSPGGPARLLESRRLGEPLNPAPDRVFDAGEPPPRYELVSYARDTSGAEWAIGEGHVFPRVPNELWHRRSPVVAGERVDWVVESIPPLYPGPLPTRVWTVGGEAWLLVWYEAEDSVAALYRTGKVDNVLRLGPGLPPLSP